MRENHLLICEDGADACNIKQKPYNCTTAKYAKSLFKRPDVLFECLYDQQDS